MSRVTGVATEGVVDVALFILMFYAVSGAYFRALIV